jgi:hypothetical protein
MAIPNEEKLCCRCHINHRHNTEAYCLDCRRKYYKEYYPRRKEHYRQNSLKHHKQRLDLLRKRKLKFVLEKGGKCSICGYGKNLSALGFHHINGRDKPVNSYNRKLVYYENSQNPKFDPTHTILVCANCHAEIEHPTLILSELKREFYEHVM